GLVRSCARAAAGSCEAEQDDARRRLARVRGPEDRSEEHTSELQSLTNLVCRLLLEKKKKNNDKRTTAKKTQRHSSEYTRRPTVVTKYQVQAYKIRRRENTEIRYGTPRTKTATARP